MNLIEILNMAHTTSHSSHLFPFSNKFISTIISIPFMTNISSQSISSFEICFAGQKIKQTQSKINIKIMSESTSLFIQSSIYNIYAAKIQNQYNKTLFLRYILRVSQLFNTQKYKSVSLASIKFNPFNGQIRFSQNYIVPNQKRIFDKIKELLQTSISNVQFQKNAHLKKIISFLNIKSNQFFNQYQQKQQNDQNVLKQQPNKLNQITQKVNLQNLINPTLDDIRSYILTSNHYTWILMRNLTKKSKSISEFLVYKDTKNKYEQYIQNSSNSLLPSGYLYQKTLTNIFINPDSNARVLSKIISRQQDNELKKKFLQKNSIISTTNQKQLTEISVSNDVIQEIQTLQTLGISQDYKINCYESKNGVSVRITPAKPQKKWIYQKSILQGLPPKEFINIVKYYTIKNNKKFNDKWEITNLYSSLNIQSYLDKNGETISLITKLSLLHQISVTLKFFRDLSIAYHNILPTNIFLKKGLILKLYDLSNVYHSSLGYQSLQQLEHSNNHLPPFNKFPYVSNIKLGKRKSVDDERSDVYSFGVFIFWLLYKKQPILIKDSTVSRLNQQQKMKKLQSSNISSFQLNQKYHSLIKLLTFFSLKCAQHQRIFIANNQSDSDCFQSGSDMQNSDEQFLKQKLKQQRKQLQRIQIDLQIRPFLDWIVIIIKCFCHYYYKKLY